MLKNLSIKWKILILVLIGPFVLGILLTLFRLSDIKQSAYDKILEKSRAVVTMAEAGRENMAKKLEMGVTKPFSELDTKEKLVEAVPVITAINMAEVNAEKNNYKFKVPKISPRNKKNEPDSLELNVLNEIKSNNLEEKIIYEDNQIRYFKPIKLTKECMVCHGDPKGELDPTGGIKEGWKVGEVHGAFEVISSLSEAKKEVTKTALMAILWTGSLILVLVLIVIYLMNNGVIGPILNLKKNVELIANGDLTNSVNINQKDELGELANSLNSMTENLKSIINHILSNAENTASMSAELSASVTEVTATASEIANASVSTNQAVETNSTALTEMAANIQELSGNINKMAEYYAEIIQVTNSGAEAVNKSINSMEKIKDSSENIATITNVITEIAGQTNLLALNAAIEAAKAGEFGKGFAVVAEEIRKLAERSSNAAKEIAEHIIDSKKHVDDGSTVIAGAGEALELIIAKIEETSNLVEEVNLAASEQSKAVEEIVESTDTVADLAAQNASASEEISATMGEVNMTTEELASLSDALKSEVDRFKI